jgi:hypothetical protein
VYLQDNKAHSCVEKTNRFLGCWFGVFPFPLHDLFGNLTPSETVLSHLEDVASDAEPVIVGSNAINYSDLEADPEEMNAALESLKAKCEEVSASRSLTSSSTSSKILGGTCQSYIDFSSVLKRYYTETFAELIKHSNYRFPDESFLEAWCMQQLGVVSHHRQMKSASQRRSASEIHTSYDDHDTRHSDLMRTLWTILDPKDVALALSLGNSANILSRQVTSLESLMQHLENRGHPEVTSIDGLTVELLPYQKQSVQWAKERESIEGGIQRFLWAKVPLVDDDRVDDLYYCPLLGTFSEEKPQLVRGGIIGEMMGRKFLNPVAFHAWYPSTRKRV